ncbi:MAG: M24 family metallopeptidase, partial [Phycisphaerales bacterium]
MTNPMDVGYLTGFLGGDSYLLLGGRKPAVVSDFRFEEELADLRPEVEIIIRKGSMIEAVAGAVRDLKAKGLALQAEHVTLSMWSALAERLKGVKLGETTGILLGLRAVKDAEEVRQIRAAVRIQQEALIVTLNEVERLLRTEGSVPETTIATVLETAMRDGGSGRPAFESIVAAGANGSLPHYRPGRVAYRRDRALLIDWGATVRGYHSDMTRTVAFGRWPKKIAEVYEIVRDAHELGRAAVRAGATTAEVDRAARAHIEKHGYGDRFGHGLGH